METLSKGMTLVYYIDFGDCSPIRYDTVIINQYPPTNINLYPDFTHTYNQPGIFEVVLYAELLWFFTLQIRSKFYYTRFRSVCYQ